MTPLDKPLKRLVTIKGEQFVVTLSPDSLKLTRKGHRVGVELKWADIASGESALAVALQASVGRFADQKAQPPTPISSPNNAKSAPRKVRRRK